MSVLKGVGIHVTSVGHRFGRIASLNRTICEDYLVDSAGTRGAYCVCLSIVSILVGVIHPVRENQAQERKSSFFNRQWVSSIDFHTHLFVQVVRRSHQLLPILKDVGLTSPSLPRMA